MSEVTMRPDCFSCRQELLGEHAPLRERIVTTRHWRVAHCFNSALEGWLVVLPRRHVSSVDELTEEESGQFGPLLRRLAIALGDELGQGCAKTYVMQFSEAEGFHHLHFHVVPRSVDLPEERRGPRVFDFLRRPESEWVSVARQDELAESIAARLRGQPNDGGRV
jgi:diadenosine tetraphosphate (Ap4A) HIT family hydrolase